MCFGKYSILAKNLVALFVQKIIWIAINNFFFLSDTLPVSSNKILNLYYIIWVKST